ncbi:MAG: hypothetical protein UX57_C0004G0045 [Candidatus Uhrbacteria bacterium GW2011_GWE2_46_68]|uniref:Uncharacterized protein n=2 Tax=Candidatus Uhriibacteriota TaxID=1752732 RepID=A0A0G1Q8G1_9BACT|nr:MAG: hypothetical protein UX45_C0001G0095 [Candidatus Uhrbacteria bacterium GW2011_GWF2_46_218]KKU41341.1 MAG: hypothetical protein UX57_C0004G0045 [Candidatus Uhrbacteria bacterium GW2011_GWE2_46_68]
MKLSHLPLLVLVICACEKKEEPIFTITPEPIKVVQETSLSTTEDIQTWKEMVRDLASKKPKPADPSASLALLSSFTFDDTSLQTLIGPDLYGISSTNPFLHSYNGNENWCPKEDHRQDQDVMGSQAEAQNLETQDKEWQASRIYMNLGHHEDAKRCMLALQSEQEWMAAGRLAVELGDFDVLNAVVDTLRQSDQTTRVQTLIRYAFELDHTGTAKHIIKRMEWKLYDAGWETLSWAIQCGETDLIPEILPDFVNDYMDEDGAQNHDHLILAYIAMQDKTDHAKAMEYATRMLENPRLNVVATVECAEGCNITPMVGTVAFWNMVSKDPNLSLAYLDRVNDWFRPLYFDPSREQTIPIESMVEQGPQDVYMLSWDVGYPQRAHLMWNLLREVAQSGGPILIQTYLGILNRKDWTEPAALSMQDREVGKKILGAGGNPNAPDLNQAEQYFVGRLFGGTNSLEAVDWYRTAEYSGGSNLTLVFEDKSTMASFDLNDFYRSGHLSREDILRLWAELEIQKVEYEGPVYPLTEEMILIAQAQDLLTQGKMEEAANICWGLLRVSGKDTCALNSLRADTPVEAGYLYDLVSRGMHLQDGQTTIHEAILHRANDILMSRNSWRRQMISLLELPEQVRKENEKLQRSLPVDRKGEVTNFPDVEALMQEIMPVVEEADPLLAAKIRIDQH